MTPRLRPLSIVLLAVLCQQAAGQLPLGTVLVSRNVNEADNSTPGFWNHLAIVVSPTEIIEAQAGRGVILTPLAEYLQRPYAPVQALVPCSSEVGERAAQRAKALAGLPYRKLGSIRRAPARRVHGGEKLPVNCVLPALKVPYWDEDRRVRRVWFPDHALRLEGLFDVPRPLSELLKPDAAPPPQPTDVSLLKP